jgi:p21-activated kinase 1
VTGQILNNSAGQKRSFTHALAGQAPANNKRPVKEQNDKRPEINVCRRGSPWPSYHRFAKLGTAATFLAVDTISLPLRIVVVKERRISESEATENLMSVTHPNIVRLHEVWFRNETIYLIYERMEITLDRLQQFHKFKEEHISIVCREVSNQTPTYLGG